MTNEPYSIHTSVGYWITRLARAMEAHFEESLRAHDMTRASWAVLSAIFHDDKTTPAELAEFVGIDGAAITRHLDRLEKQGLMVRDRSSADRRSINLRLTSKGEHLVPEIVTASMATNAAFTGNLNPSEIGALQQTVQKMLSAMDGTVADI